MPNTYSIPYPAWNSVPDGRRSFLLMLQQEEDDWLARRPKDNIKESLEEMKYKIISQLIDVENKLRHSFIETSNIMYNHVIYTVEETKNKIRRLEQKYSDTKNEIAIMFKPKIIYLVPPFDVKTSVDVYLRQFNLIAKINEWADSEKVANLIAAMHRSATRSLKCLIEKSVDFNNLQRIIRTYFYKNNDSIDPLNNILILEHLGRKKRCVSIKQLTQSVDTISNQLPNASQALIDYLQIHYFIFGMTNVSLQRKLANQQHMSLGSALDTAEIKIQELT